MDARAAKLALARKKLKDHQVKKCVTVPKEDNLDIPQDETGGNITSSESELAYKGVSEAKDDFNIELQPKLIESEFKQNPKVVLPQTSDPDVNVTEILISNKRNLEMQVSNLQLKLSQLEYSHTIALQDNDTCKQQINSIKNEFQDLHDKYLIISNELQSKDKTIEEMKFAKAKISEENNNLTDQLDFTKTILTAKETEINALHSQMSNLQNELDVTKLNLKQLTNGTPNYESSNTDYPQTEKLEIFQQKVVGLEQKIKILQKERDQMKSHYEHYVAELNEQLKSVVTKNHELQKEVDRLSDRERGLIDQISQMEIRIQNFIQMKDVMIEHNNKDVEFKELTDKYVQVQDYLKNLSLKYEELQKSYTESEAKVKELSLVKEPECNHNDISITKLNADIASDKIAAQRATEQNKKLKSDVKELQEAFIKMSNDKLELTEKLAAEKYLNRELTIKLAEIEEKAKNMHIKLMAKDEEMIRLQTIYRDVERKFNQLSEELKQSEESKQQELTTNHNQESAESIQCDTHPSNENAHLHKPHDDKYHCLVNNFENKSLSIPKLDAMSKLQERFLKIMEEVADLSDEKHRLEHIILQLQNETDTICEYVALYQQQRSLLKKRDEERSAQIKLFQSECDRLKIQLEELNQILVRFAEDKELSSYFEEESRQIDVAKVMKLLSDLKNNTLVDPVRNTTELKNFYPCSCCSGKLIDV